MEHIDEDRLETDLEYRFNYLCNFMNFGGEEIEAIKGFGTNEKNIERIFFGLFFRYHFIIYLNKYRISIIHSSFSPHCG